MKFKKISPALWVSPQIEVADVARLAEMGVRSIVNNRPDGESDDQPDSESLARAAAAHGPGHFRPVRQQRALRTADASAGAGMVSGTGDTARERLQECPAGGLWLLHRPGEPA